MDGENIFSDDKNRVVYFFWEGGFKINKAFIFAQVIKGFIIFCKTIRSLGLSSLIDLPLKQQ